MEDTLDELNGEFFQLSTQALQLRREEAEPGPPPAAGAGTSAVSPAAPLPAPERVSRS